MRVGAVLIGSVLAAVAPAEGHSRAIKIADTMASAIGKMVGGLEHFLAEAHDAKAERSAHALIGDRKGAVVTEEDVLSAEAKGEHLASQMARNLHALAAAAKALQAAAREAPAPPKPMSEGERDGYVMALENKVEGQKKAIEEMDEEKKSLVSSVANLMHRGADTDLKQQLADARAQIVQLEQAANAAAKEAAAKASSAEDALRSDNVLLTQKLEQCDSKAKADGEGKVEESIVTTEVKCKADFAEVQQKLAKAEAEHDNMVQTVQMMVQDTDGLKAQLAAKANCTTAPAPPAVAAAPKGFDVAHMAETVKIDQYIATNGNPTNGTSASFEPIKPVKFKEASVHAATEALAGRGDIGKYLRGAKETNAESKSGASAALAAEGADDAADLDQQIDSLLPEDVDVLKAADAVGAKKVRKAHGDDNLAQKLLLQAEAALKNVS